jgi:hypothetical protein
MKKSPNITNQQSERTTRTNQLRSNEMRDDYDMDYQSPLRIPDSIKKDGFTYRWVNTGIKGEEDYRMDEMAGKGWTLVPVDRAPQLTFDPLNRNPLSKQYICYKDVILMERPSVICDREKARMASINKNKIQALRGVNNDMGSFNRTTTIDSF